MRGRIALVANAVGKSVRLAVARIVTWRRKAAGIAMVALTAGGDASYLVRIKLR